MSEKRENSSERRKSMRNTIDYNRIKQRSADFHSDNLRNAPSAGRNNVRPDINDYETEKERKNSYGTRRVDRSFY